MDIFSVITLLGGLAFFLYGMRLMGDGLEKAASGRLEQILSKLTNKPIHAVLLGAGVTAVIQSSSATTVIVVGLVSSGIMQLKQAVGVIMGANIGTTLTSWLLSLTGLESDTLLIKLLKPTSIAPLIALIGIVLYLLAKDNPKRMNIGSICMGFAILMFGMETMSDAMNPLAHSATFETAIKAVSNPLLGMIVGMLFTALIQSSSASVGILQALCLSGMVSLSSVIPMVLGQNIGTCATALISSIGGNKDAKRASMIHLYFNIIGATVFAVVFYGLNLFLDFKFLSLAATPATVAVIHSIFNIGTTVMLFLFSKQLVRLAEATVKDDYTKAPGLQAQMKA